MISGELRNLVVVSAAWLALGGCVVLFDNFCERMPSASISAPKSLQPGPAFVVDLPWMASSQTRAGRRVRQMSSPEQILESADLAALQAPTMGVASVARQKYSYVNYLLSGKARLSRGTDTPMADEEILQLARSQTGCGALSEVVKAKADQACLKLLSGTESASPLKIGHSDSLYLSCGRYLSASGDRWAPEMRVKSPAGSRSELGQRFLKASLEADLRNPDIGYAIARIYLTVAYLYDSYTARDDWQGAYSFLQNLQNLTSLINLQKSPGSASSPPLLKLRNACLSARDGALADLYLQFLRRPKMRDHYFSNHPAFALKFKNFDYAQGCVNAFNDSLVLDDSLLSESGSSALRPDIAAVIPLVKSSDLEPLLRRELEYLQKQAAMAGLAGEAEADTTGGAADAAGVRATAGGVTGDGVTGNGATGDGATGAESGMRLDADNYSRMINVLALLAEQKARGYDNYGFRGLALPENAALWPDSLSHYLREYNQSNMPPVIRKLIADSEAALPEIAAQAGSTSLHYMMALRNVAAVGSGRGAKLEKAWQIALSNKTFPLAEKKKVLVDYIDWLESSRSNAENLDQARNLRFILDSIDD